MGDKHYVLVEVSDDKPSFADSLGQGLHDVIGGLFSGGGSKDTTPDAYHSPDARTIEVNDTSF